MVTFSYTYYQQFHSTPPGVGETVLMTRDYCGDHIYLNGDLERVITPVGYYDPEQDEHHAYVKDYRSNVRADVTEWNGMAERSDYYPYGMQMCVPWTTMWAQPYKFMGKELDRENGWDSYDVGARWLTSSLCQWTIQDPLTEATPWLSPYSYCAGDPINHVDTDGMKWKKKDDEKNGNRMKSYAQKEKKKLFNKRNKKEEKHAKLIKALDSAQNDKKDKIHKDIEKLDEEINDINTQISTLDYFIAGIDKLNSDENHVYTFHGLNTYNPLLEMALDGTIIINFSIGNEGNRSHETAHAIQVANNEIWFEYPGTSIRTKAKYHSDIELKPYQIQFILYPRSMPSSTVGDPRDLKFKTVNRQWIRGIFLPDGTHPYPD